MESALSGRLRNKPVPSKGNSLTSWRIRIAFCFLWAVTRPGTRRAVNNGGLNMKLHTTLIDLTALSLCAACGGGNEGNATPPEDTGTGSTGGQTGTGP